METDLQFQFFLAKLFGQKVTQSENDCTLTGFSWRGKLYLVGFTYAPVAPPIPPRSS